MFCSVWFPVFKCFYTEDIPKADWSEYDSVKDEIEKEWSAYCQFKGKRSVGCSIEESAKNVKKKWDHYAKRMLRIVV